MGAILFEWGTYLTIGAAAGFLAGLLGIGGGLVIVPALAAMLGAQSPQYAMHMAVATSLSSILATGTSSVLAHHRRGGVDWSAALRLAPALVVGSLTAAWLAAHLDGTTLRWCFAGFCLYAGWRLVRRAPMAAPSTDRHLPGAELAAAGAGIGLVSALVGIGGGTLAVPYLHWRGRGMRQAIGTAAACGLPIAAAGAAGYMLSGWTIGELPGPRLGFVYLPALLGISAASVVLAPLGAAAAHRLPVGWLRRVFGVFLLVMAVVLATR